MAATKPDLKTLMDGTAKYMLSAVPKPDYADIGGEWAVLGLARSGYPVPDGYFEGYYGKLETYVKSVKGVLHEVKYTDYSRVVAALSALGKDARDVGGYDLLAKLNQRGKALEIVLLGDVPLLHGKPAVNDGYIRAEHGCRIEMLLIEVDEIIVPALVLAEDAGVFNKG